MAKKKKAKAQPGGKARKEADVLKAMHKGVAPYDPKRLQALYDMHGSWEAVSRACGFISGSGLNRISKGLGANATTRTKLDAFYEASMARARGANSNGHEPEPEPVQRAPASVQTAIPQATIPQPTVGLSVLARLERIEAALVELTIKVDSLVSAWVE